MTPNREPSTEAGYGLTVRVRLLVVLFISAALNRTGFIAVFAVTALVAEDILGSVRWSGLAVACATLGMAAGTTPMAALMARRGRRPGYVLGLAIAVVGAVFASYGAHVTSFVLLLAGMFVFGFGSSADRLGRYAASDIAPASMRGSAIAAIVWAGTIGSVVGPILLPAASRIVEGFGYSEYLGGYLVGGTLAAVALVLVFAILRPDPLDVARVIAPSQPDEADRVPLQSVMRSGAVRYAMVSLVVGQGAMVLIMTMTPNHIRDAGEGLTLVALVISVHTFGMYFFAPISGYLSDRVGKVPVIVAGQILLLAAALIASKAHGSNRPLLLTALFLLGLGWSFGFVASSSLITDAAEGATRVRLQGAADTATWATAALASAVSGILLDEGTYLGLSLAAGAFVLIPLVLRYVYRDSLAQMGVSGRPDAE